MSKISLEELMVRAIRQFKRENKDFEIRNIYAWEWGGNYALFNVECVDKKGEYQEIQIRVTVK